MRDLKVFLLFLNNSWEPTSEHSSKLYSKKFSSPKTAKRYIDDIS